MSKNKLFGLGLGLLISISSIGFANAQDTTTTTTTTTEKKVIQNADGSYSVIEYPVDKEVTVELTPLGVQGAKGWARVMRRADGTTVALDLSGLPADSKNYYVYAVDPAGRITLLGPATIADGVSKTTFTTPMNQFMLVLSPNEGLSTFGSDTPVVFRSAVPAGYAVVPAAITSTSENKQVAVSTPVASSYDVPLLDVPKFSKTAEIRINFTGDLAGLKGKAYVDPTKGGVTKVKMRFDDMKMAPKNRRFVLWAASPEGKFTKLGQVINTGERQESEIRSETALSNFGLFVTVEETDVDQPTSTVYAPFTIGTTR
ncbi:MAG TPA: hypothetical protein VK400_16855 [Pyrinomonadaceae bacterium]|nr:hypothetical protein [Pyrinomonadaceae bacterium]